MTIFCIHGASLAHCFVCAKLFFVIITAVLRVVQGGSSTDEQASSFPSLQAIPMAQSRNQDLGERKISSLNTIMHSASQLRGGNTGQLQQKKKDMDTCNHESSRCFGEKLSGIDPENERIDRDQSSRNHQNNRKLLNQKSSTQERTNKTTNITSTHSETGAPFHLDYSSPQTHPPTSN